jgi:hypothetical protein
MLVVVGAVMLFVAVVLSIGFATAFRVQQGAFLAGMEAKAPTGEMVPRWVSLMYLIGLATLAVGIVWLVAA